MKYNKAFEQLALQVENKWQSILNPVNQCQLTGLEDKIRFDRFNLPDQVLVIRAYLDCFGRIRIVLGSINSKEKGYSAILLDRQGYCELKYTSEQYRGNAYTRQLFAWAQSVGIKAKHSGMLTPAGLASI